MYRGPDAVRHFRECLKTEVRRIEEIYKNIVPMNELERLAFINNNNDNIFCHICNYRPQLNNNADSNNMVVHHNHLTGRIRGWACN